FLQGVEELDVADAAVVAGDVVGHGGIALLAPADRPIPGGAHVVLPLFADRAPKLGEDGRGAAALGPVNDAAFPVGQLRVRVVLLDPLVVPLGDVAGKDTAQHLAGEVQGFVHA